MCSALAWSERLGFTTSVSERLAVQLASRFGPGTRERVAAWQAFPRGRKAPEAETAPGAALASLNAFFNRIPFVDDLVHWSADDYWATPAEMFASNGADCEDFSVSKYFMLKELGVPVARLRITYVTSTRVAQPHMVLAYYPAPDADPLILDNLENTVRPASQRRDLSPVYSFNDDDIWLPARGRAGSSSQIRKWRVLLETLEREARL